MLKSSVSLWICTERCWKVSDQPFQFQDAMLSSLQSRSPIRGVQAPVHRMVTRSSPRRVGEGMLVHAILESISNEGSQV